MIRLNLKMRMVGHGHKDGELVIKEMNGIMRS